MTAATLTPRTPAPASAPAKAPGGLIRTMLRLHRWALWLWVAYVALFTGLLLWAWTTMGDDTQALLASCEPGNAPYLRCPKELEDVWSVYDTLLRLGLYAIVAAPFLAGAWASASLTARELETGTAELAWTQSVSPARWLTAKLAVPAVAVGAGIALLLAVYRPVAAAGVDVRDVVWYGGAPQWWSEDFFTAMGVVAVPRALCAVAVGALLGFLLRRSLASLGTGLLLMTAGTVTFALGRHRLWPSETRLGYAADEPSPRWDAFAGEWPLDSGAVTGSGEHVAYDYDCLDAVLGDDGRAGDAGDFYACLKADGYSDVWASYHPKSHYWPLQLVESGIWLAVAALAVFLSYRVLRRRTA
ncbi:ABC transporter permease [Streptomyces abyssomicinicus]|uniref:ABC transporter permease n=1 Tax=Streptomyces abyssomicinicus TaxID=574929 RepID=UPI00124F9066|nr:ABC transporter permease [Streptomyces abyssomicinicus]